MTSSVMTKSLSGNSGLKPRWHIFVWRKYGIDTHHLMLKKKSILHRLSSRLNAMWNILVTRNKSKYNGIHMTMHFMDFMWVGIKMKCSVYIGNGENGLALHKDEKQIMCTFRRFSLLVSMIQKFIYVG